VISHGYRHLLSGEEEKRKGCGEEGEMNSEWSRGGHLFPATICNVKHHLLITQPYQQDTALANILLDRRSTKLL
jgi:hypothetical protein